MIELAKKDDVVELKKFARTMVWAFPLVFSIILPFIFSYGWQWWPLVVSGLLGLFYFARPQLIYYPYRLWMGIALVLGWINTRIILGFVFFFMIWPLGLVLRILKKLQYQNAPENTDSFYIKRDEKLDRKRLEFPF